MLSQSSIVDYLTPYRPIEPWVLGIDQTVPLPIQAAEELRREEGERALREWAQQHGYETSNLDFSQFLWIGAAALLLVILTTATRR